MPRPPLGVVCCHFNPCSFAKRLENYYAFRRELCQADIHLLTVELAFGTKPFEIEPDETELLRVRSESVLWQKERLLNIGLKHLRAAGYQRLCYLDADVVFLNPGWVDRIIVALEDNSLVQVFETSTHFGLENPSAVKVIHQSLVPHRRAQTGLGWAFNGDLLDQVGLYENLIVGGGDTAMFHAALLHERWKHLREEIDSILSRSYERWGTSLAADFRRWSENWTLAVDGRIGYAANQIMALPHGKFADRGYGIRSEFLREFDFNPRQHLDGSAVTLEWRNAPSELQSKMIEYFYSRKEDSG